MPRDGVTLLGHVKAVQDGQITLAPDLRETLAAMEKSEADELRAFDVYAAVNGIDAPEEKLPQLDDGYRSANVRELDLEAAGITTVIWATGYQHDYSLVKLPVCDETGYPRQQRGVTEFAGLYFVGLHWLYNLKSDLLIGVGEDAAYVVDHIVDHTPAVPGQSQARITNQENA